MSNYNLIKNAAILAPSTDTDIGTNTNPVDNIFMSGNLALGNTIVTSTNVLTPKIVTLDYPNDATAASLQGDETLTLIGSGFQTGLGVYLDSTIIAVSTVVSSSEITFNSPAKAAGNYPIAVINPDGGTATFLPGITYSALPNWATAAGNIANVYEYNSVSVELSANSDSNITYTVSSGSLPSGVTLNSTTGLVSGTAPTIVSGATTYNFAVTAEDAELQDAPRSFSITVNADSVTWNTPSANADVTLENGSSYTLNLSATSASGRSVSYTANALPSGLSLTNGVVSGTPTTNQTISSLFTATESVSGKFAQRLLNYTVAPATIEATGGTVTTSGNFKIHTFTGSGTFNVTKKPEGQNIDVLVVAGGGSGGSPGGSPGGGGAGGLIYQTAIANFAVAAYTVTVGAGGAVTTGGSASGSNSSVSGTNVSLTAIGGGGGGVVTVNSGIGKNGGSGGGGDGAAIGGKGVYPGSSYLSQTRQGYDGGVGFADVGGGNSAMGGGGGGAGEAGMASNGGGAGLQISITGTATYYAGGGGGGRGNDLSSGRPGGLGGGGNGGGTGNPRNLALNAAQPGSANTGGGGGGGRQFDGSPGGAGGSGIVIFRYQYQ